MRFVPSACLREGMINGRDLYGKDGILMLRQGQEITVININRINSLGYQGIYIVDEISKDIDVQSVIDDVLRQKTIGAVKHVFDCIQKNDSAKFTANIEHTKMLVENIIDEMMDNKDLIINMVDLKMFDDYTYYHSVNVAVLSIVMGISLNLSKKELYNLGLGALLHDIGKVFVPKDILNKKGQLSNEELSEVQSHSERGYHYLREIWDIPLKSYMAVLYHHEKFDGSGYPKGKKTTEIHLFGRIIAIADVYDALISDRPYRKALLPSEAVEYVMGGSGILFDPDLVKVFVKKVAPYPLGTCVKLSNGDVGIVIENYEDACLRPKLKLFMKRQEESILDLKSDEKSWSVTIVDIVDDIEKFVYDNKEGNAVS